MIDWVMLAVSLLTSAGLTFMVLGFYRHRRWLDVPDSRSAHDKPMPSSGGIAMVVVFTAGIVYYLAGGLLTARESSLFLGCLPIALVGLIDDFRNLDFRWRLAIQFASAIYVVLLAGTAPAIRFGPFTLDFALLVHIMAVLAFVWLLNLFNFMDGIDGLAAGEASFVMLMASFLFLSGGNPALPAVALLAASVALGFLVWNWPPAKIFMGDVGSNFLAYSLGAIAVVSIVTGSMNPWSWLLLLGVFVVDATYTLCYRFLHGQRWYEAHSSHGYQHLARRVNSHGYVTLAVLVVNCMWLAPLAWLAGRNSDQGLLLTVIGYLPLTLLAWKLQAGVPAAKTAR
jgi:Fuc2NAc and GlcNAc transferase